MSAGAINKFICRKCGGHVITINRDDGMTPFRVKCRATKDCDGFMESEFCMVSQTLTPTYEWRWPTKTEYFQLDLATREEHVDRGGLLLYPVRPPAEPEFPKREKPVKKKGRNSAKRRRNRDRANAREFGE